MKDETSEKLFPENSEVEDEPKIQTVPMADTEEIDRLSQEAVRELINMYESPAAHWSDTKSSFWR